MVREPIIQGRRHADNATASKAKTPFAPHRLPADAVDLDDDRYDEELRPKRLADVVGQKKVLERLQIIIDATLKRKEPLGHLLLDGPPGIGKTPWPRSCRENSTSMCR